MHTIPVLPLSETNREALRRHFLALDKEDLRLRFEHAISEATLMQYVDSLDFEHDAVFGVFDDRLELAGVAHLGKTAGWLKETSGRIFPLAAQKNRRERS